MTAPVDGAVNVMAPPYFAPEASGLEPALAPRVPARRVARRCVPWLQLLTHPEIWVYEGATMAETMRSLLETEHARRVDQLRADRIDIA